MEPNPFIDMKETDPTADAIDTLAGKSPAGPPASCEALEKSARSRRWLTGVIVIALVFGLGFVPMWLKAGRHANERDMARRDVRLLQLESVAGAAALDARRGEYEAARQSASWFFTALSTELELGAQSSLSPAQQDALKPLVAHRDGLITLLARSDPASAERLASVYLTCRQVLRGG
jgi:hypothetical protein